MFETEHSQTLTAGPRERFPEEPWVWLGHLENAEGKCTENPPSLARVSRLSPAPGGLGLTLQAEDGLRAVSTRRVCPRLLQSGRACEHVKKKCLQGQGTGASEPALWGPPAPEGATLPPSGMGAPRRPSSLRPPRRPSAGPGGTWCRRGPAGLRPCGCDGSPWSGEAGGGKTPNVSCCGGEWGQAVTEGGG